MWSVVLVPHTEYHHEDGKNRSGLKVMLEHPDEGRREMVRVAFRRKHGSTRQTFKAALMEQIEQAEEAARLINEHERKTEEAKRAHEQAKRDREAAVQASRKPAGSLV